MKKTLLSISLASLLCACQTTKLNTTELNKKIPDFTLNQLKLNITPEEREQAKKISEDLLLESLTQENAMRLAISNSPAMQKLLSQFWALNSKAIQKGRLTNPAFTFERIESKDIARFSRLLSFNLLELLMFPQRQAISKIESAKLQLTLSLEIIKQITDVKLAWIQAVADKQKLQYSENALDIAVAGNLLAKKMETVGNYSKLQALHQRDFYLFVLIEWQKARNAQTQSREALVRTLGLDDRQAKLLNLPYTLPTLPTSIIDIEEVSRTAVDRRLDIQIAQYNYEIAMKEQSLSVIKGITDIKLGIKSKSSEGSGGEVTVTLPIFDSGNQIRAGMNAKTLANLYQLENTLRVAGSLLRERYANYLTSFEITQKFRKEILPTRQLILDESLLRYNGMLMSPFEVLTDAKEQINGVLGSIDAEAQFLLNEAKLQATMMGELAS